MGELKIKLFDSFVENAKYKLDNVQNPKEKINNKIFKDPNESHLNNQPPQNNKKLKKTEKDFFQEDFYNDSSFEEDQMSLYPSQKSEGFHFFILENQYQDLERAIRGVKDVWDKQRDRWIIKKKNNHCFTDEESEEIVRTAQTHLSSDIKLAIFNKVEYNILLDSIYDQLWVLFKMIMDYRFGRFGDQTNQLKMKLQAINIFNMLTMRIKANYSRAVEGRENAATHDSVKGQESLNHTERREHSRNYT